MEFYDWLERIEVWAWEQELTRVQGGFFEQLGDGRGEIFHIDAPKPTAAEIDRLEELMREITRKRRG
jgi:hypothetical protein